MSAFAHSHLSHLALKISDVREKNARNAAQAIKKS